MFWGLLLLPAGCWRHPAPQGESRAETPRSSTLKRRVIHFADIEKAIDEQDDKWYIEEPDGTRIPCSEPNEYAYAVGEGCHIALALDRDTIEAYGVDTAKIGDKEMNNLLEAWCVEINDALADDSGRDGLLYRTLHRVAYDMGFADSDGE